MNPYDAIARALAAAFIAGGLDVDELDDRAAHLFARRWRWLRPLARRVSAKFGSGPRPRHIAITQFLLGDRRFLRACDKYELEFELLDRLTALPEMTPFAAAREWSVPAIHTPGELAEWLEIRISDLEWYADLRSLATKKSQGRLRHYHYRPLAKPGGQIRLIEATKPRLKTIQRRILAELLDQIPAHAAAHGFRRGRSIRSFASAHVGRRAVLRIDLRDFFPSISRARVQALFRTVGYPDRVADLLAGLCTTATPLDIWDDNTAGPADHQALTSRWLYAEPHLPQGAPTSPALANLCAYRLDCRLSGLAAAAGGTYTRYADDLAFSGDGDFERSVKRFHIHACATAMEEGFTVQHRKTRTMRTGVRQRLAGLVVNQHLNVPRADYDRLKAMLTNCIRHGPASQNRAGHEDFQAHLLGRVSFVTLIHPPRGQKLRELFEQIVW